MVDVTSHDPTQVELRRNHDRFQHVAGAIDLGVWYCDLPFGELVWDERVKRHFGLAPDARVTIETFYERIHLDDREKVRQAIDDCVRTGKTYDTEYRTVHPQTGEVRWIRALGGASYVDGRAVRFDGITLDVTEEKRLRSQLQQSEAYFREIIDTSPALLWVTRSDGYCTYLSQQWSEYTGRKFAQDVGFGWLETVHSEDREAASAAFLAANARQEPFQITYRVRRADGVYRWAIDIGQPKFDPSGAFEGFVGMVIDVHDAKASEIALRESEERFRLSQEASGIGTFEWDILADRIRWTPQLETLHGLAPGSFGGDYVSWHSRVHPEDSGQVARLVAVALATGQLEGEWRIRRPDGNVRWINGRGYVECDGSGRPRRMLGVNIDVTERKLVETVFRQLATGAPASACLETLVRLVESQVSGARCVVLAYDSHRGVLDAVAAPSLPEGFIADVTARPIAVGQGPCAAAVLEGRFVVASTDSGCWKDLGEFREKYGIVAAWSQPVLDARGSVVGTFAMLFREGRSPDSREREHVRRAADIAGVVFEKHAQELALRHQRAYLSSLVDSIPHMLWAADEQGRIFMTNGTYRDYSGTGPPENVGPSASDIVHPDDRALAEPLWRRALETVSSYAVEQRIRRRDGEFRWHLVRAVPTRDANGKVTWFGTNTDVHDEKMLQQSMRELMDNFDGYAGLCTTNGTLRNANAGFLAAANTTLERERGRSFWECSWWSGFPESVEKVKAMMAAAAKGEASRADLRYCLRKGQRHEPAWCSLAAKPLFAEDGRTVEQIVVSGSDITERVANQEELARSNAELARFAYVASHDLKEPIRVVSNYAQLLQVRYRDRLDERAHAFLEHMVSNVKRMYALIDDLLRYSHLNATASARTPVDLNEVARTVRENLDAAVVESGAELEMEALPTVAGDRTQLTQLLQNLVANALKYRGERAPRVCVTARRDDGHYVLGVKDNGIGIPKEYWDKIFVLFERLHGGGRYDGTGIGLALCKRIAERHGGRIWVDSTVGEGSTFHVALPAVSPAELDAGAGGASEHLGLGIDR